MQTDRYTKFVLSLIAIGLILNGIQGLNLIPPLHAESPFISSSGLLQLPVDVDGVVRIKIENAPTLQVKVVDFHSSQEIDVNLDEIGGGWIRSGGPLMVEVKD